MSASASSSDSEHDHHEEDHHEEDHHEEDLQREKEKQAAKASFLSKARAIEADVPDEVWLKERKCLLMLLEARMLLRELVEYKLKLERMASGNLTIAEIQNLLAINADDADDTDFISEIQELKRLLVKEIRRNHALERELQKLDTRIALLIANRTSIQEIDRQLKKKKREAEAVIDEKLEDFSHDKKKMEGYANLFYALQVEPKYLAKLAYVLPAEKLDTFMETLLLTLYGDAFSPREEFLILNLFKHAMELEVAHIRAPSELSQADSVITKIILTYNKRKLGVEYLKNALTAAHKDMMVKEYNLHELKALTVYQKMINDMEVKTNKKTKLKRDVTEEEAAADPNVKAVLSQRTKDLQEVCQMFLDRILSSMTTLPYGLRLICSQIRKLLLDKFPKTKPDEIWAVLGYLVYYRFINVAIIQPDSFDIGGRDLSMVVRKNLIVVGKVLQYLFRLAPFPEKDELASLNPWIDAHRRTVAEYFADLIGVPPPEDYLQVNQYMELTQRSKPMIIIAMREIVETHDLLKGLIDQVAKDKNDPLQIIIRDLGDVPKISQAMGERDMQLILENRFKGTMEDEVKPGAHTYAETKELIIRVLKQIPIKAGAPQTLLSLLEEAGNYAKDQNNKNLGKDVAKILKNFQKLEEQNLITKKDNYTSLLKDVALEVTNRSERREQQQKEIARLQATLKNLKKHQEYMNEQIGEFEKYLASCRTNSAARVKTKSKPVKFGYKDLVKKGVIVDSEVPEISRGNTKFFISMPNVGVFDIEAKIAGMSVGKMNLELEDLLEKKENGTTRLELDQVTLNVPATILLINHHFLS